METTAMLVALVLFVVRMTAALVFLGGDGGVFLRDGGVPVEGAAVDERTAAADVRVTHAMHEDDVLAVRRGADGVVEGVVTGHGDVRTSEDAFFAGEDVLTGRDADAHALGAEVEETFAVAL